MGTRKQVKTGLRVGGGPEPGYLWGVEFLDIARDEAMGFLSEPQYQHLVDQMRSLASEDDPTHPKTVSVDAIEDFHEMREKGGPLGKLNVRVFFLLQKERRMIVVIGAIKKENDGPTPTGDRYRMKRRKRKLLQGSLLE